ncbi:MAG: DUF6599 family protein [Desulfobacterales bacterium]
MTSAGILQRILRLKLLALTVIAVMSIGTSGQIIASQSLPVMVAGSTPKGWQIFDEVKQFTPKNLYEQINGRAAFFLAYDMIRMTYVRFVNSDETTQFINLSIYDMGTPTNAFGVFSAERSQGESSLDLGRSSYRADANYFIWKGQYYIRIISAETTDEFQRIGMDLARKVTNFLLDSGEQVWGLTALPLTDRMPESVQYFKVDAMGLDFMRNTYTATYRKGNTLVTAFLSQQDSAESARTTMVQYAKYAKKYGKGIDRLKAGEVELVSCDMGGTYDVVYQKGRLIGGVTYVEDRSLAIRVAIEMWEKLRLE